MAKFVLTAQLQLQAPKNVGKVVNQIQQQLKGINVDVEARGTATAKRQIEQVRKETDKAAKSADNMGKAFSVSIRRFTALAIATRAVSLFSNSLGGAVKEAISFERELVKISQVTGKTMSDLRGLTDTITNLSTRFGVASSSLLNVSRILSQAGFDAKQTEIALSTLARTELAPTFDNITQTAEGAVAIFNQFRKGAEALESQLGSINAVAGKFAVEAGDLISVVRRAGGVFKASGGQLNELIALFTSVRSTTRESADSIATGLRTIFTRIQRPKTVEYLKQFGVELIDLEGKFVGPFDAAMQLGKALAGLEQGDTTFIKIAEELGGFRQIGKVIPLLQQTRVAQEALNVAQGGANSLAGDAAAAQQTLAVRLDQTQQKFIALIRSISETYSFQLMANAALAIADSIVKIGEAIKPVLPLITALAAVKLAKGFGLLGGGLAGGGVKGFASGGVVPGTGNSDTVPAMLTPGEFVIKKQSVNKIGADRLASMNRYATGGQVRVKEGSAAGFFLSPEGGVDRNIDLAKESQNTINVRNKSALQKLGYAAGGTGSKDITMINSIQSQTGLARAVRGDDPTSTQAKKFSGLVGKVSLSTKLPIKGGGTITAKQALDSPEIRKRIQAEQGGGKKGSGQNVALSGMLKAFFPGKDDVENSSVARGVDEKTAKSLSYAVKTGSMSVLKSLKGGPLTLNRKQIDVAAESLSTDSNALSTTSGFVFEGIIQALTGAKLQGKQSNWDFLGKLNNFEGGLGGLFSSVPGAFKKLLRADAKRTNSSKSRESIINKIESDINKGISAGYSFVQRKAGGGGISGAGTDTVPALLTPGEFVVNKKSAQSIGYGTLGRMNKVGKYANGGIVQRFEDGGPVPGDKGFVGPLSTNQIKEIKTAKTQKNLAKLGVAAFATTTALSSMIPAAQETDSALLRMARGVTDATTTTVGSVGALGFALQGLGENFSIGKLIKGKFTGPIIGAGASAMFMSSAFESIVDSTNRFNDALKDGTRSQAIGLATRSSSSGARAAGSLAVGAGVAGLAALFAPFTVALGAGAVAAAAFTGAAYSFSDGFQDILSGIGFETSEQIKAQAAAAVSTRNFSVSLREAADRAKAAFKEAQGTGEFVKVSERVFSRPVLDLASSLEDTKDVGKSDARANRPERRSGFFDLVTKVLAGMSGGPGMATNTLGGSGQVEIDRVDKETLEYNKKFNKSIMTYFEDTANFVGSLDSVTKKFTESFPKENAARFKRSLKAMNDYSTNIDNTIKESTEFINESFRSAFLTKAFDSKAMAKTGGLLDGIDENQKSITESKIEIDRIKRDPRISKEDKEKATNTQEAKIDKAQSFIDRASKELTETVQGVAAASGVLGPSLKSLIANIPNIQGAELARSLRNISSELEKLQARFKLINLGLSSFNSSAAGARLALQNFVNSVEGNGTDVGMAFENIKLGLSENASGLAGGTFNSSVSTLVNALKENSATDTATKKVESRLNAARVLTTSLDKFIKQIDPNDAQQLNSLGATTSLRDAFAEFMKLNTDIDQNDPTIKSLIDTFKNTKFDDETSVRKFAEQDFSVLQKGISTVSQSIIGQLEPSVKELVEIKKIEFNILKKAVSAQQAYENAQRVTLKTQMTVAKDLSKFGGKVVSISDRLSNVSQRINIGGGGGGITNKGQSLLDSILGIEELRGTSSFDSQSALLQEKYIKQLKDLVPLSQEMFKIRQDEINIIKEKNALERSSQDALLSGDLGTLFKNFQTNTAMSIGASGDTRMAGQVESEAFLSAIKELERRRSLGQPQFNGVEISKAIENTAFVAFSRTMGSSDARVMAQRRAGTDPESLDSLKTLKAAGDETVKITRMLEKVSSSMLETAQNTQLQSKAIKQAIMSAISETPLITTDQQVALSNLSTNIAKLTEQGVTLKSEQNITLTLMGGELLAEMKRFDSELVANELAEAFSRAKIGDNGQITLG